MRRFAAALALLAFSALSTVAQQPVANPRMAQDAADDAQCASFGAKAGTDAYVNCRVGLTQMHDAHDQQEQAAAQARWTEMVRAHEAAEGRKADALGAVLDNAVRPGIDCTSTRGLISTETHCR